MERDRLFSICKWSHTSFDSAYDVLGTDYYRYIKYDPILESINTKTESPFAPLKPLPRYELKIGLNQFGFYSWLPSDNDTRAFIREHVVKPLPYTTVADVSDDSKFICEFVEKLTTQEGFLTGVSLTKQTEFDSEFTIFFGVFPRVPVASFVKFNVSREDWETCADKNEQMKYIGTLASYCIWSVLHKVKGV